MIKNKKYIDIDYQDKKQLGIAITILVLGIIVLISSLVGFIASFTGMVVLFDNAVEGFQGSRDDNYIWCLIVAIGLLTILLLQVFVNSKHINKFGVSISCLVLDILQIILLFSITSELPVSGDVLDTNALAWVIIVFDTITYSSLITIIILALFIIED